MFLAPAWRELGFVVIACLFASPGWAAEPKPDCGTGIPRPRPTAPSSFEVEQAGVFFIEGGLFRSGVARCIVVSIECLVGTNECTMFEARLLSGGQKGPITLTDPMGIVEWTMSGLKAVGKTHLCQSTQLTVDFARRKVQLVATPVEAPRCPPVGPPKIDELRYSPKA
jgi:hypothetical protein